MKIVKNEFDSLLEDNALQNVPFLILGNKIDAKGACSEAQLIAHMGLENTLTDKSGGKLPAGTRPVQLFMCSIFKRSGYADGFKWLANYLN